MYSRYSPFTDPQIIIIARKEHNFISNRAAMLKSSKTRKYMPIYIVNVMPRANFKEKFNIIKLCYIPVVIERFKGSNIVKKNLPMPTIRSRFGNFSEICRFVP